MRRGPLAVVAAASGLAAVVGFHSAGPAALSAAGGAPAPGSTSSGTAKTDATGNLAQRSATGQPGPAAAASAGPRSATGAFEQYGYGQLAVRVTVNGRHITKLAVVGLSTAESYSQQLAAQVIPMLHHEVIAAQSPSVNGISGATYTTEAYLYSIQSALDKLHVK